MSFKSSQLLSMNLITESTSWRSANISDQIVKNPDYDYIASIKPCKDFVFFESFDLKARVAVEHIDPYITH